MESTPEIAGICKPGQVFLLIHPALNRIITIQDNTERARIVERPVRDEHRRKGHAGLRRLPVRSHGQIDF